MSSQVETIKPYSDREGDKTTQVRDMFDAIAPAYDFMNRAMTLGIDRLWRRKAVKKVAASAPVHILDVACGTGDMALAMAKKIPAADITGIDLSENMLAIGRNKIRGKKLEGHINLQRGDSLDMPFDNDTFDCVTVAYGVRNFSDLAKGYAEFFRVLQAGGFLCVVELSVPRGKVTRWFYRLYTRHLIPLLGCRISKDRSAYAYLPASIEAVAQGEEMLAIAREAGFVHTRCHRMTFGTCSIYTAVKP